jgi:shikimate dehydrogenase
LSPALHNAAFQQLGLDWAYAAFDVAHGEAQAALDAMRTLRLAGLSVTMPHKDAVASAVDLLDPAAAALRSVNTVVPQADGSLKGYSTDGAGFIASLAAAGVPVAGRTFCILGGGGAARSIVDALGRAGAARVAVVNRTQAAAAEVALLAGGVGAVGTSSDITAADIVVNATSVGMATDELPCDAALLRAHQIVADIVYHPRDTALLQAARAIGAVTVEGLGMLVHQAALQQQLWHGLVPDVAVMSAAAELELAARRE